MYNNGTFQIVVIFRHCGFFSQIGRVDWLGPNPPEKSSEKLKAFFSVCFDISVEIWKDPLGVLSDLSKLAFKKIAIGVAVVQ